MAISIYGSYQRIPIHGWIADRKPGMQADLCTIDLDLADLTGGVFVEAPGRLWAFNGRPEPPGPFLMPLTDFVRSSLDRLPRPTITEDPPAKGLDRGGPLVMYSSPETIPAGINAGALNQLIQSKTVTLTPMYLLPSGIDEINEQINSQNHTEGFVRVTLADIRWFWKDYGTPVYGSYNVVKPNGRFDTTTTAENGRAYSLREVLNYLALCLPGSPKVDGKDLDSLPTPQNLVMRHELPSYWLSKILEAYELELHLTPDSNIYVAKRATTHAKNTFAPTPGAAAVSPGDQPSIEKKTVFVTDKPEAVAVVGGMRTQRHTVGYTSAFIDEDGKVKRLSEISAHWPGYNYGQVLSNLTMREDVAWLDIPGADVRQKARRAVIAQKYFFKLFAPNSLFTDSDADGNVSTGARVYWDFENRKHPFFPASDPWWVAWELADVLEKPETFIKKQNVVNPTDLALVQTSPVVKANLIRQIATNDLTDATNRAAASISSIDRMIAYHNSKIDFANQQISLAKSDDFKQITVAGVTIGSSAAGGKILIDLAKGAETLGNYLIHLSGKLAAAIGNTSGAEAVAVYEKLKKDILAAQDGVGSKTWLEFWDNEKIEATAKIAELLVSKEKVNALLAKLVKVVKEAGYFRGWANLPWGPVKPGDFDFNYENGLVLFHERVGIMESVAVYDEHDIVLTSEGAVEVTFGSDKDTDNPRDQTNLVFVLAGGVGNIACCESSEMTLVKPFVIRDESIVIRENDFGQAMNFKQCVMRAAAYAVPPLSRPDKVDGYYYEYAGVLKVSTDESVNQVTWYCDGDVVMTKITANNPDKLNESGADSVARKKIKDELIYRSERESVL